MKMGLILGALFILVLNVLVFLLILASSLLDIPLTSAAVETAPPATPLIKERLIAKPLPSRQPNYATQELFETALPSEPYLFDNADVQVLSRSVNGLGFESIVLLLESGKKVSFDNNTVETDDNFTAYSYVGLLPSINTHLLRYTKSSEQGYLLVDRETAAISAIRGALFKVPQSALFLAQNKSALELYAQQPNGLFTSVWHSLYTDTPIAAVAKDTSGRLILKTAPYAASYAYLYFEPGAISRLWNLAEDLNLTVQRDTNGSQEGTSR